MIDYSKYIDESKIQDKYYLQEIINDLIELTNTFDGLLYRLREFANKFNSSDLKFVFHFAVYDPNILLYLYIKDSHGNKLLLSSHSSIIDNIKNVQNRNNKIKDILK